MGVRDRLGKHDHDRVATDVRTAPANLSMCVQHNAVRLRIASREPGLAGKALLRRSRVVPAFGELLTRDPTNQPAVSGKLVVHALEKISGRPARPPAAGKRPTIDAGGHKADDMRFHANLVLLKVRSAGPAGCFKVTLLKLGIARRSPFPTSRRSFHRAIPESQRASSRLSAWRRANASSLVETTRCLRVAPPLWVRPRAGPIPVPR